jgi:HNH endonuclease/NUMOD4 motif
MKAVMHKAFEITQLELFEKWLPVVGFEGAYEISDWGRVRSVARPRTAGGLIKPRPNKKGYLKAPLWKSHKQYWIAVHRLVMIAFVGSRPTGLVVDHIDGNKTNNALSNLRYVTPKENVESSRQRLGEWRTSEQARRNWIARRANPKCN